MMVMGMSAAEQEMSNEDYWDSEDYLFRIESDIWIDKLDKCSSVEDLSLGCLLKLCENVVVDSATGEETLREPLKIKISPGLEDLKTYLEWFSNVYGPGIQLGRNKPDSDEAKSIDNENGLFTEIGVLPAAGEQTTTATDDATDESSPNDSDEDGKPSFDLHALFERLSSVMASPTDVRAPMDELTVRELAVIRRLLLHRFLIQRDYQEAGNLMNVMLDSETENDLFEILRAIGDHIGPSLGPKFESQPHFTVGEWTWASCQVCFEHQWLYKRACCGLPVCTGCLKTYFSIRVNEGVVKIECCNSKCKVFVHRDEISACLDAKEKQKFHQFLAAANADPWVKTCPRCNHVTTFPKVKPSHVKNTKKHPVRSRLVCTECSLTWCFNCHAPWHPGFTCKQYRKGDRLMKSWANEIHHGQLNAQKCPRCQVYIQRTTGCDHMHCSRCKTDFCYRCGDRLRKLRFFGDHYSKLSVFGCKFRYKADRPLQRKLVRGAIFGSKLMVAPLLGTLGACAGVIALGFGVFILPVYGGVRLYQKLSTKGDSPFKVIRFN